jgi:hypothetical protein
MLFRARPRAILLSRALQTVLNLEKVRIREVGMMSTLLKPLCGALVVACGALVLITDAGPLATPALAQATLAQTEPAPTQPQPEKPNHPRPRVGDPTTTPAPPPPLSPETKTLRSKLDAFKLDLDQKEAALGVDVRVRDCQESTAVFERLLGWIV